MNSWHRDLDRKMQARREAEAKRKAEEEARIKRQKEEQEKSEKSMYRRFRCYICGKRSEKPSLDGSTNPDTGAHQVFTVWSSPGDLTPCSICKRYACYDNPEDPHISYGICKNCYAKGYMPGDNRKWWDIPRLR
jgi:hypothetical protein